MIPATVLERLEDSMGLSRKILRDVFAGMFSASGWAGSDGLEGVLPRIARARYADPP